MGMSAFYGTPDEAAAHETIDRALELGVTFLDTADWRRDLPRFKDGNLGRNLALVEKVEEIAREKGVGVSQVALAWVLSRGEDVIPIPGTKRVKHLETNAAALDIEFTDEELERLDEAAPLGVAVGDRYPDMSSVNI